MNKYLALQKDVFDINKVTVVGSPTITSEGVASGLSSGNYVEIPNVDLSNKPFVLEGPSFIYSSTSSEIQYVFLYGTYNNGLFLTNTINASGYLTANIRNGATSILYNVSLKAVLGYKYQFKFIVNASVVEVYIKINDGDYSLLQSVINTSLYSVNSSKFFIGTENATSTKVFKGSIDLTAFKIYVGGQLVFQPTKPTYLLERRKPKVWNKGQFTIVGNPSISDDGVASGFSSGNHILLPNAINFTSDCELRFSFICTNTLVNERIVGSAISGNARLGINIGFTGELNEENKLICWISSGTLSTDAWDIIDRKASNTTFQTNQLYYIILQFKNGVYSLKSSTDNINWVTEWAVNSSLVIGTKNLALGCPIAEPNFPFQGSINLKQFKIYTDNILVFDGGAETYVYDPSKFTIVGSPTITEYGVASGFGDGKYINTITLTPNTEPWSIIVPIITGSSTTGSNQTFLCKNVTAGVEAKLDVNGKFVCYLSSDGSNPDIAYGLASSYVALPNTKYYFRLSYDGAKYEMAYSFDKENFTVIASKQSDLTIKNGLNILLGANAVGVSYPFQGSIDLPSTSITVDVKEIFTGAKENYYMLRR